MKREKTKYSEPQIKFFGFRTQDIRTSGGSGDYTQESGIDLPIDPFE